VGITSEETTQWLNKKNLSRMTCILRSFKKTARLSFGEVLVGLVCSTEDNIEGIEAMWEAREPKYKNK
jgi:hypothetical protein